MDKALAKERLRGRKCPYCGADRKDLAHGNVENDGKEVFQVVDCTVCEKHFTEVYSFCRVILTDYPGEDFRIDFNDLTSVKSKAILFPEILSRVRSSGNKATEKRLIKIFRKNKIKGWRREWPLPGKPDFVFPKKRIAVFVDGCFWHGCPIHGTIPKTNREFWEKKISRNSERDKEVNRQLSNKG